MLTSGIEELTEFLPNALSAESKADDSTSAFRRETFIPVVTIDDEEQVGQDHLQEEIVS